MCNDKYFFNLSLCVSHVHVNNQPNQKGFFLLTGRHQERKKNMTASTSTGCIVVERTKKKHLSLIIPTIKNTVLNG
jgi:hypothetical protein